jgi:DNA repair protein RecO (recombination protein O)
MDAVVYLQPALILQHRPYRESSLLLEVFTQDYGVITVIAKGVRKEKSRTAGLLLPFALINLSFLNKNEVKTLTQVELISDFSLQKLGLYCGFYVNELVQRFLHRHDPYPQFFFKYLRCLQGLANAENIEQTLRFFELDLLAEAGYGIQLDINSHSGQPVKHHERYHFSPQSGIIADANGIVAGHTLKLLAARQPLPEAALLEAKHLCRAMLDEHLHDKPLKSRAVLAEIIKYL